MRGWHESEARKAQQADVTALVAVLTRAFSADPLCSYLFPDSAVRGRKMRWIFERELRTAMARGGVYTTPDLAGAAVWRSPEESTAGWFWEQVRAGLWRTPFQLSPGELARGLKLMP